MGRTVLAVDLGKTRCRVRIGAADAVGAGAPGLAERGGTDRAIDAIADAAARLPADLLDSVDLVGIGAAGASTATEPATELARRVVSRFRRPVAVTSDIMTAHVGALGGAPGVVLVAGTGAVAVGLTADGTLRRADGWGIWLGDDGSGRWIGRSGLRAALRAADGRGPATSLLEAARRVADPIETLPAHIGGNDAPERRLAAFAPAVLAVAADNDPVASSIVDTAIARLVETALAAAGDPCTTPVAVLGGLTNDAGFAARLRDALSSSGLTPISPADDALAGAAELALRTDLPHENQVFRVRHLLP
jgi:N-acetylglucosamine kinase-like BadF-type ATPase